MKNFLLSIIVALIMTAGSFETSAGSLGGGKKKGYSNSKIIKKNNKKRQKAGKSIKLNPSSSQGKRKNYPFS